MEEADNNYSMDEDIDFEDIEVAEEDFNKPLEIKNFDELSEHEKEFFNS